MRHYTFPTILAAGLAVGGFSAAYGQTTVTYIVNERADLIGDPPRNVVFAEQYISKAMFEPLVFDFEGRTGESGIRPALATSWEIIDDNTWHFFLREGVTFHNGEPFNAEAVKFSIERHLDPDFPSTDKFRDVPITAVNVIDDYTVEFVTETPVPILPERLSRNGAFILAPGHYADLPLDEAGTSPVGTGPYMLEEFRRDDRVIMTRNDDWWGWDENSNIDRLVIRMIPEMSTAFSEVMAGNADIVRITPDLADVVVADPNVDLIVAPTLVRAVTIFNLDMYPELQDPRVRVALNLAVDREAMIDAFAFGQQELVSTTLINPPNEHPDLEPYPYDPERARELLAEAGFPDGFTIDTIDVMIPDAFEFSEAVAQFWGMVGVEVGEVRRLESSVMRERWAARTLSVASYAWSAAENTPETDAWAVHDDRQTNSTHWVREDFLEAYREITQTVDPGQRDVLNRRMQEILYEDPPWVYLYRIPAAYAVSSRIEGYNPHPSLLVEDWGALYVSE